MMVYCTVTFVKIGKQAFAKSIKFNIIEKNEFE